jgi:hypothetical protein
MPERIEGNAPQPASGVVAQPVRYEPVRRLVGGDRNYRRHRECGNLESTIEGKFHRKAASGGKQHFDAAEGRDKIDFLALTRQGVGSAPKPFQAKV